MGLRRAQFVVEANAKLPRASRTPETNRNSQVSGSRWADDEPDRLPVSARSSHCPPQPPPPPFAHPFVLAINRFVLQTDAPTYSGGSVKNLPRITCAHLHAFVSIFARTPECLAVPYNWTIGDNIKSRVGDLARHSGQECTCNGLRLRSLLRSWSGFA